MNYALLKNNSVVVYITEVPPNIDFNIKEKYLTFLPEVLWGEALYINFKTGIKLTYSELRIEEYIEQEIITSKPVYKGDQEIKERNRKNYEWMLQQRNLTENEQPAIKN